MGIKWDDQTTDYWRSYYKGRATRQETIGLTIAAVITAALVGFFFPFEVMPWNQSSWPTPPSYEPNLPNEDASTFNCLTDGDGICDAHYKLTASIPGMVELLQTHDPNYNWADKCLTWDSRRFVHTVCVDGRVLRLDADLD